MAKIRRKDGTLFDAPAGYTLQDGESLVSGGFQFMDSVQRSVADEQHISDAQAASDAFAHAFRQGERIRRESRAEYYHALTNAWRSPPPSGQQADHQPQPTEPGTLDECRAAFRAASDAADAAYRERVSNMWRT